MKFVVTMGTNQETTADLVKDRTAYLGILDWDSGYLERTARFRRDPIPGVDSHTWRFAAGSYRAGRFYTCTLVEVVVFDVSTWAVQHVISLPTFNDLHHICATNSHIAVVNTGLECVELLDYAGRVHRRYNLLDIDTWERFDRTVDYRTVKSTKPHEFHVNYVTEIDGQLWATRCIQKDVVNLDDPAQTFEIGVGNPHDGCLRGEHIYYTTTNNHVVVVDRYTKEVVDVLDIPKLAGRPERYGWCRGIEVVGDHAFVGFTRFRRSKWRSMGHWIKYREDTPASRIIQIDLRARRIVRECPFRDDPACSVFSITALPKDHAR